MYLEWVLCAAPDSGKFFGTPCMWEPGLTLLAPGFLAGVGPGGGVCFPPPSITPLSLKLDYSNFVHNYFGIR